MTADFFTTIGVQPVLGRGFLPDEDQATAQLLLSATRFGDDTSVRIPK